MRTSFLSCISSWVYNGHQLLDEGIRFLESPSWHPSWPICTNVECTSFSAPLSTIWLRLAPTSLSLASLNCSTTLPLSITLASSPRTPIRVTRQPSSCAGLEISRCYCPISTRAIPPFLDRIHKLVQDYGADGLRTDTVKHIHSF